MLSSPSARNLTAGHNRRASRQCSTTKYPAVPNRRVSLQCATAEHSCSDQQQPQSTLAAPNSRVSLQGIPAVPNPAVFLQCPGKPIPVVPKPTVFLQCSVAESPCGAQPLQCRAPQMLTFADFDANLLTSPITTPDCYARTNSGRGGGRGGPKIARTFATTVKVSLSHHTLMFSPQILPETLRFLCNNSFRLGCLKNNKSVAGGLGC